MENAAEVENDLDEPITSVTDQEKTDEMQQLLQRVKQLELENGKIQEEFGHQRAKMKELYVQKEIECKREIEECSRLVGEVRRLEVELGEAQSQLLAVGFQQESDLIAEKEKCQSEISSLQQLIQETVEESSTSRSKYEQEIRRLRGLNEKLDTELQKHRSRQMEAGLTTNAPSEGGVAGVLSPGMITAVTKSLARKVVSLAPSASTSIIPTSSTFIPRIPSPTPNVEPTAENLEDCMRKAQEDAEVLRSLVIPLEQEIKALKDKLRSTDEQLQWYRAHTQVAPPSLGNSLSADQLNFAQETESNLAKPGVSGEASLMDSSLTSLTSLGEGQRSSARSSPIQFSALQEAEEQRKMEVPMSPGPRSIRSMTPVPVAGCDMCANYEAQLQKVQQSMSELERQNKLTQRAADRYREDLAKETEFRKEMENKWSEKKEEHKMQVERLSTAVTQAEQHLAKLQHNFEHTQSHLTQQLGLLTREREEVHKRLDYLQDENEKLVGKYSAKAAELQDESINLPDNVEELQVLLLQTREDLITSKVGKEAAEEQRDTLQSELHLVRHEMGTQLQACSSDNEQIRKQLKDQTMLRAAEQALQITVAELKKELAEMRRAKAQVERAEQELRNRVASLQEDLDNNEATQQDFVQLSQSLQMELERLREAEKEVRWQHEDDVDECAGCRAPFSVTRRKVKGVEEVSLMPLLPQNTNAGAASAVTISKEAALQHAAQLEHNIRFLREQHHIMLTSLHKEVEALRQRNRELQFQLVMSSAASSAPISLLQDIPNSPEDDTRPRVILSPRQPNLSPLQVEILEKDLAELRIDLKEERDKNQQLYGIVQEQQRKIELLKTVSALTPRYRDAQCQAGAAGCAELGRKLEETQRTVKTLRRENEEQRKELSNLKANMSRSQQSGSRDGYSKEAEVLEEVQERAASSGQQHRFPPLHNAGYWQQQQQHRPGMEFSGSSRTGERRGQRDKDTASVGSRSNRTTLPALHGANMYVFSQNNRRNSGNHFYNNNNNNGSRQGYYRATGAAGIRAEEPFEGIQGRKYRGGRGQRERQLQ